MQSSNGLPPKSVADNPFGDPKELGIGVCKPRRLSRLALLYQPKIHTRSLQMQGAEALLHVHHPGQGFISPSYVQSHDPTVGEFMTDRIFADLGKTHGRMEMAIRLPVSALQSAEFTSRLREQLPRHFDGLIIEIDSSDAVHSLQSIAKVASELQPSRIAVSIHELGDNWPRLSALQFFPFVEISVGQSLIQCAAGNLKARETCHHIVELANGYGARTVAHGIETWADLITSRDLGFDLAQGSLFAKPMTAEALANSCWSGRRDALATGRTSRSTGLAERIRQALE
jgi:EAL domain-containing protein (putative c-di-GMP-specific phosphodiesterase class I)